MLFLELFLSALTLLSIWAITNHHHSWGVPLALFLQFGWVAFWFYLKTYGFILIDAGMILVYGQYLCQPRAKVGFHKGEKNDTRETT